MVSHTSSNTGALVRKRAEDVAVVLAGANAVGVKASAGATMSANSAVLRVFMIKYRGSSVRFACCTQIEMDLLIFIFHTNFFQLGTTYKTETHTLKATTYLLLLIVHAFSSYVVLHTIPTTT